MKSLLKKWGSFFVVTIIFFFIGRALYQNWSELAEIEFSANFFLMALSFCLMIICSFLFASGWFLILKKLDGNITYGRCLKIYFLTNLAKYIPGKIWNYAGQIHLCSKEGVSRKHTVLSLIITVLLQYLSGMIIFLLGCNFYDWQIAAPLKKWLPFFIPIFFIVLYPAVIEKVTNWVLQRLHYDSIHFTIPYRVLLMLLFLWGFIWALYGAAHFFLLQSFYQTTPPHIFIVTASLAGASVLGSVISFVPVGLGVTEGALIFLLSSYFPISVAALFALMSRMWRTANDIFCPILLMRL